MTLDKPDDRAMLLHIVQNSTIPGNMILAAADLVTRIQSAKVAGATDAQTAADSYYGDAK